MDRRAFIAATLAGLADAGVGPSSAPSASGAGDSLRIGGDPAFSAWAAGFAGRAILAGVPAEVVTRELGGLTPEPKVAALDGRQPEFERPVGAYVRSAVSDARVAEARRRMAAVPQLPAIAYRFGVPSEILVAIWGLETAFGQIRGDFDVIRALATLAAAGRRRDWAETQLIAALMIISNGLAGRAALRGSWAGAMGQTQIEPETFLRVAEDGDGDGRIDVWDSSADALASAARLLQGAGWRPGRPWAEEVRLPAGFDYGLSEGVAQPPTAWARLGVRPGAQPAFGAEADDPSARLILPAGAAGPAFLVFDNHFVLRAYNNSLAYALSAGRLADRIAGAGPLSAPWPEETPLSAEDRRAAQAALRTLGFDPGAQDGMIGAQTRASLRRWQASRGLPADGYLSPDVLARLRREAASGPGGAPVAPSPVAPPPAAGAPGPGHASKSGPSSLAAGARPAVRSTGFVKA